MRHGWEPGVVLASLVARRANRVHDTARGVPVRHDSGHAVLLCVGCQTRGHHRHSCKACVQHDTCRAGGRGGALRGVPADVQKFVLHAMTYPVRIILADNLASRSQWLQSPSLYPQGFFSKF